MIFSLPPRPVALLAVTIVLAGCASSSKNVPTGVDPEAWVHSGADMRRSSHLDASIDPPLERVWDFDLGAGTGPGSPLVVGDQVIVGTRKGMVLILDLERGKRVGREKFDAPIEGGMALAGGTLVVPGAEGKTWLSGYDFKRGKERWKLKRGTVEAGVLVMDSLGIAIDDNPTLRVIELEHGRERWSHPLDAGAYVIAAPVAAGTVVYLANEDGVVYAVDVLARELRWRRDLAAPVYQSLGLGEGLVFVPTTRGQLLALDALTGETRWSHVLPDTTVRFSATAYDEREGVLAVGTTDGQVLLLRAASGSVLWTATVDAPVAAAPLLTASTLYVGTLGRMLIALDRSTATRLWEYQMPGRISSAMAATDGTLLVLSEPQRLYAFRPVESATPAE